jgi:hypothetical protein
MSVGHAHGRKVNDPCEAETTIGHNTRVVPHAHQLANVLDPLVKHSFAITLLLMVSSSRSR